MRSSARWLIVLVLAAVLAGCGDDDLAGPTANAPADTAPADTASAAGDGEATSDDEDPSNPWVLGYRVAGEPGTVVLVTVGAFADGAPQPAFEQTITVPDDGETVSALFTVFVDSVDLELVVTDGGPATVQGIEGRLVDPEDPFGDIEVREELSSVEVAAGDEPVTLSLP